MTIDYQAPGDPELFRAVNRKILELQLPWENEYELVCECASPSCLAVIRIEPAAYEAVCSEPSAFVVCPGHHDPDADEVVTATPRYSVVRHAAEERA